MSVAERSQMMKVAGGYNICLYEQGTENIGADDDIRRVADLAMNACQSHLDTLHQTISDWGFEEHFATGFTRNVRDRAVRRLLPELAIRKSH